MPVTTLHQVVVHVREGMRRCGDGSSATSVSVDPDVQGALYLTRRAEARRRHRSTDGKRP